MSVPDTQAIVRLAQDGERARRACERVQSVARMLETAVQRSLPYLARKRIPVTLTPVRTSLYEEAMAVLGKPCHVTPLRTGVRGAGALVLDGSAVARVVDGVLGGGRGELTPLEPSGLTPAQTALAARLSRGLVAALDEVLRRMGTSIAFEPEASPERHGGVFVVCSIRIAEGDEAGHIVLLLPAAAIDVGSAAAQTGQVPALGAGEEAQTVRAVSNVEVDVIAELGRVRIPLERLATLQPGDLLRLPLSIDVNATVRVGERVLLAGRPTTRGTQIAIEVLRHGP